MVVILDRNEAERLQHANSRLPHRTQDLGHGSYRARLRLKRDFDEIALGQRTLQLQQSSGRRNGF
jgi:hypothetical protein